MSFGVIKHHRTSKNKVVEVISVKTEYMRCPQTLSHGAQASWADMQKTKAGRVHWSPMGVDV